MIKTTDFTKLTPNNLKEMVKLVKAFQKDKDNFPSLKEKDILVFKNEKNGDLFLSDEKFSTILMFNEYRVLDEVITCPSCEESEIDLQLVNDGCEYCT